MKPNNTLHVEDIPLDDAVVPQVNNKLITNEPSDLIPDNPIDVSDEKLYDAQKMTHGTELGDEIYLDAIGFQGLNGKSLILPWHQQMNLVDERYGLNMWKFESTWTIVEQKEKYGKIDIEDTLNNHFVIVSTF